MLWKVPLELMLGFAETSIAFLSANLSTAFRTRLVNLEYRLGLVNLRLKVLRVPYRRDLRYCRGMIRHLILPRRSILLPSRE